MVGKSIRHGLKKPAPNAATKSANPAATLRRLPQLLKNMITSIDMPTTSIWSNTVNGPQKIIYTNCNMSTTSTSTWLNTLNRSRQGDIGIVASAMRTLTPKLTTGLARSVTMSSATIIVMLMNNKSGQIIALTPVDLSSVDGTHIDCNSTMRLVVANFGGMNRAFVFGFSFRPRHSLRCLAMHRHFFLNPLYPQPLWRLLANSPTLATL